MGQHPAVHAIVWGGDLVSQTTTFTVPAENKVFSMPHQNKSIAMPAQDKVFTVPGR